LHSLQAPLELENKVVSTVLGHRRQNRDAKPRSFGSDLQFGGIALSVRIVDQHERMFAS
jgi:hypothetical protein